MPPVRAATNARVVKILAPLACFWLGLLEVEAAGSSPGVPPEPRRRLAVVPLIPDKRYYGESPASLRRAYGPVSANGPPKSRIRIAKIRCPKHIPNVKPTLT